VVKCLWGILLIGVLFFVGTVSATNVAYVKEDATRVSDVITDILDDKSLTYDVIKDSEISSTDFSGYNIVLVVEDVDRGNLIPFDERSAIFFDRGVAGEVWDLVSSGQTTNRRVKVSDRDSFIFEDVTIPVDNELSVYKTTATIHSVTLSGSSGVDSVALRLGTSRPTIAVSSSSVKDVFFGLPDSEEWNANAEKMFENALDWLMLESNPDEDGDGFHLSEDCDDRDSTVYPGATERPYDGKIQDCNRDFDLIDVDGDGYCKKEVFIDDASGQCINDLGLFGTDCKDDDETVWPGNPDLAKNCVLDPGEESPPTFLSLTCETGIDEDVSYTCLLEADASGSAFDFSVESQDNLVCSIEGDELTYKSVENYNGDASCDLLVSNSYGSDSAILEVIIAEVNDAPEITSFTPDRDKVIILEDGSQLFSIVVDDVDSADLFIEWLLNGRDQHVEEDDFLFEESNGIYDLEVIISDGELEDSKLWQVIVGPTTDFTCEELDGHVIENNKVCSGELWEAKDTSQCCSIESSPSFKDAKACDVVSYYIDITIDYPDSNEDIEVGDEIDVLIDIDNDYSEDQNFDVEVHLYNLDDEKSEESVEGEIEIDDGESRALRMDDLLIPTDLDLEKEYVLFVKVDDDICSQKFMDLEIERPQSRVIISDFELPERALCGETITAIVEVENAGSEDRDVIIKVRNDALGIREEANQFELEKYGDDDGEKEEFTFTIPEDTGPGEYDVKATVDYSSKRATEVKKIEIECKGGSVSGSQQQSQTDTIQLSSANGASGDSTGEEGGSNLTFYLILIVDVLLVVLVGGYYWIVVK